MQKTTKKKPVKKAAKRTTKKETATSVRLGKKAQSKIKELRKGAEELSAVMPQPKETVSDKELRIMVADILGVSTFGITIIKGVPYINKLGRKQKLEHYGKKKEVVIYEWVEYSKNDTDKAICKAKIVTEKKELTDWIVGECSPASMGMSTLAGYQNHMAQTRAHNRVIEEKYGLRIHEDMLKGMAKSKVKDLPDIQTVVSAEEISTAEEQQLGESGVETMIERAKEMIPGITDKKSLQEIEVNIKGSKIYNDEQKEGLLKLIQAQRKIT